MDRVKGKVAIVTGGASGIGEAAAKILAREGADIAIVDISVENGRKVVNEIKADGGVAAFWQMNVADERAVEKTFDDVYKRFERLHILVNNAGIPGYRKPPHETTTEEWNRVINVNLKGAFFCTRYAAPYMIKSGGGSIINIASVYGIIGCDTPVYDTSKGGMRAMTKSDALVYAKSNIRVNSIHPGNIDTTLFRMLVEKIGGGLEKTIRMLSAMCPLDRMGTPEDVANGVLFLASDESSYVTATELVIDGGMLNAPLPVYADK